jgi:hypothetical protein
MCRWGSGPICIPEQFRTIAGPAGLVNLLGRQQQKGKNILYENRSR